MDVWRRIPAVLVVAGLAACGGSAPSASSDNVQVCRTYLHQRAWVKGLTAPSMTDAVQFEADIAVDQGNATPGTSLARDLTAMQQDQAHERDLHAVSARVLGDCAVLGVTP